MPTAIASSEQDIGRALAFEEARDAMVTLRAMRSLLTPGQMETLEILMDDEARRTIFKSMEDVARGNVQPLSEALREIEEETC